MNKIEAKVLKAVQSNRLNLTILEERNWYNYFIRTTKLVWSRNLYDGYLIELYCKDENHLCSIKI
jgi:hypothetical protein